MQVERRCPACNARRSLPERCALPATAPARARAWRWALCCLPPRGPQAICYIKQNSNRTRVPADLQRRTPRETGPSAFLFSQAQTAFTSRRWVLSHGAASTCPSPDSLCGPGLLGIPTKKVHQRAQQHPSLRCTPSYPCLIYCLQKRVELSNKRKCSFHRLCVFFSWTDRPNPESPGLAESSCAEWRWTRRCGCVGLCAQCHSPVSSDSSWLLKSGTLGFAGQLAGSWKLSFRLGPMQESIMGPKTHLDLGQSDLDEGLAQLNGAECSVGPVRLQGDRGHWSARSEPWAEVGRQPEEGQSGSVKECGVRVNLPAEPGVWRAEMQLCLDQRHSDGLTTATAEPQPRRFRFLDTSNMYLMKNCEFKLKTSNSVHLPSSMLLTMKR
ncbi:uncharacterized protein LOC119052967 [Artibeus jamaicensis]|uniref:uncharacterized protein LOC119052967 n=1 Tax=Artibeus jamaicensis TaxID=9417 RepID=UPI00235A8570|nr:uncharacterized protein LOC119052967 [Artibeus jamaicensis]